MRLVCLRSRTRTRRGKRTVEDTKPLPAAGALNHRRLIRVEEGRLQMEPRERKRIAPKCNAPADPETHRLTLDRPTPLQDAERAHARNRLADCGWRQAEARGDVARTKWNGRVSEWLNRDQRGENAQLTVGQVLHGEHETLVKDGQKRRTEGCSPSGLDAADLQSGVVSQCVV